MSQLLFRIFALLLRAGAAFSVGLRAMGVPWTDEAGQKIDRLIRTDSCDDLRLHELQKLRSAADPKALSSSR